DWPRELKLIALAGQFREYTLRPMVSQATEARSSGANDEEFRHLVESHERAVRMHCYRMLGSLQDAEDVTQETLIRAWRSLDRFEGRGSSRGWLYRIATNACLDE